MSRVRDVAEASVDRPDVCHEYQAPHLIAQVCIGTGSTPGLVRVCKGEPFCRSGICPTSRLHFLRLHVL